MALLAQGIVTKIEAQERVGTVIWVRIDPAGENSSPRPFVVHTSGQLGDSQMAEVALSLIHGQEVTLAYLDTSPIPSVLGIS